MQTLGLRTHLMRKLRRTNKLLDTKQREQQTLDCPLFPLLCLYLQKGFSYFLVSTYSFAISPSASLPSESVIATLLLSLTL